MSDERNHELLIAKGNFLRLFQALNSMTRIQGQDVLDMVSKIEKDGTIAEDWQQQRAQERHISTRQISLNVGRGVANLREYFDFQIQRAKR
jgi:hypothetical protein